MKVLCTKNKFGFSEGITYECDAVYACTYFGKTREESWVYKTKDDDFVLFDFKEYPNFFKEVKETPKQKKPKWKIGERVVFDCNSGEKKYIKLFEIQTGKTYFYNKYYTESELRDPTEEELKLHFR